MPRIAIVFVENKQTGTIRPARYSGKAIGQEVFRQQVFRSFKDLEDLDDQDLFDLAREMNVTVTTKTDTAQLIWFQANRTQSLYLAPIQEGSKRMAKAAKKKVSREGRGRPSELHGKKIHIKAETNPRRKGSLGYKSFNIMKEGMLVEDFLAAGGRMVDLRSDVNHKYVEVR